MKKVQIQLLFLVFILISPLVSTSISQIKEKKTICELCDVPTEEEESERESEEEKEIIGEFILYTQQRLFLLNTKQRNYFSKKEKFNTINKDVLTPPPKFS